MVANPGPSQPPADDRYWKHKIAAALLGMILIVAVSIWLLNWDGTQGVEETQVVEEQNYKCVLTGADRTILIENGVTVSDRITTNDVSNWAAANGLPGLTPGQIGWELASTVTTTGSDLPRFGEGDVYLVPYRLKNGITTVDEMTPEAALLSYQQFILKTAPERRFYQQAIQEWLAENAP
ncbi:MAG: hypothetical protein KDA88_16495 [Planctomycetaceae bacterium]|nr:hypothetical protein [Planctomycetaceae bacterium]